MDEMSKRSPRNVAQVRSRIDTGETGEKVDWPDPSVSPLGTDAEAGGHAPTREQVKMDSNLAFPGTSTPRRFGFGAVFAYGLIACVLLMAFAAIVLSN